VPWESTPTSYFFNLLQLVITINWTDECVRWELHLCHWIQDAAITYANLKNVCNFCSGDHLQNVYEHGCSAVLQNPPSAFTFKVMSNGPLWLKIWNILLRQNINTAKNSARNLVYESTTTNMATVWNCEVKSNKFNIFRICTLAINSLQREHNNSL
jgi:hypothetical protein